MTAGSLRKILTLEEMVTSSDLVWVSSQAIRDLRRRTYRTRISKLGDRLNNVVVA